MHKILVCLSSAALIACGGENNSGMNEALGDAPTTPTPTLTPTPSPTPTPTSPTPTLTPAPSPTPTPIEDAPAQVGRSVQNSVYYPVVGEISRSITDTNNFENWQIVEQSNATISVAEDTRSITFRRSVADDNSAVRAYIEHYAGPIYDDKNLSVCFDVTDHSASSSGSAQASLELIGAHLNGRTTRTPSSNGTWCTVLTVVADADRRTRVRLGIGVNGADTKTNALTISNFSFSPTSDGLPNEFVLPDIRADGNPSFGYNGAAFNFDKNVSYDSSTGLTSFEIPAEPNRAPSKSMVLMITDSFGAALSRGLHLETYFGQRYLGLSHDFSMIMQSTAGRSLMDTSPSGSGRDNDLLNTMLSAAIFDIHEAAAPPGIAVFAQGINDFLVDEQNALDTYTRLREHVDWAHEHSMSAIIATAAPALGFSGFTEVMEDERDSYNEFVRAYAEQHEDIYLVDYDLLLDSDRDGVLDLEYNSDFLHLNDAGYSLLASEYVSKFEFIRSSVGSQTNELKILF